MERLDQLLEEGGCLVLPRSFCPAVADEDVPDCPNMVQTGREGCFAVSRMPHLQNQDLGHTIGVCVPNLLLSHHSFILWSLTCMLTQQAHLSKMVDSLKSRVIRS